MVGEFSELDFSDGRGLQYLHPCGRDEGSVLIFRSSHCGLKYADLKTKRRIFRHKHLLLEWHERKISCTLEGLKL